MTCATLLIVLAMAAASADLGQSRNETFFCQSAEPLEIPSKINDPILQPESLVGAWNRGDRSRLHPYQFVDQINIFTFPSKNCSSRLHSVRYCYVLIDTAASSMGIFQLYLLHKSESQFEAWATVSVGNVTKDKHCLVPEGGKMICCATTQFEGLCIPSEEFTFGILSLTSKVQLLRFGHGATMYQSKGYMLEKSSISQRNGSTVLTLGGRDEQVDASWFVLKFNIGIEENEDNEKVTTPSSANNGNKITTENPLSTEPESSTQGLVSTYPNSSLLAEAKADDVMLIALLVAGIVIVTLGLGSVLLVVAIKTRNYFAAPVFKPPPVFQVTVTPPPLPDCPYAGSQDDDYYIEEHVYEPTM